MMTITAKHIALAHISINGNDRLTAAEKADEAEKPCRCGQTEEAGEAPAEKCACGCASEEKTDEENK